MPSYQLPGVYVTENPLATSTRNAANNTTTAAFIGTAPRGPVTATFINSWAGYKAAFGDATYGYEMGYSLYHYFANGGRDAYIVRVPGSGAASASSVVAYNPTGGASASLFTVNALSVGTWGNTVQVTVAAGSLTATSTRIPTFSLTVSVTTSGVTSEVERWNELSTDPTSSRYAQTIVNQYSKYITLTVSAGAQSASATWAFNTNPFTLAGGTDGSAVASSDYVSALSKLDVIDGALLMNAPGITNTATVTALLQKAYDRGNSFVIIDPTADTSVSTIGTTVVNSYPTGSTASYGAVYYPQLKMVDPTKTGAGAIRDTPPGGAVAGCYIRSEIARTVAKAPAGYAMDVRNAFGLSAPFTTTDVSTLYDTYNINTFKAVPGGGIVINGTRTLDKSTPGKYIPIRRSLNYVKQSLKDATAYAVFEPNNETLWANVTMRCSSVLAEFWRAGGLKGANAQQAYYVICNSSNNTTETMAQGQLVVEVGVALQYPAEFIVITVSQWTGGSNAVSSL